MLHRDFGIPRGAATVPKPDSSAAVSDQPALRRGTARLSGIVRDERGRPLSGAQVVVWGSAARGSTGSDGRFSFSELPSGTQSLEARHIGYAPRRVAVDLVSDSIVSATVTLDKRADVLGEVTIYGKHSKRVSDLTGFLQRSKGGFGHFLTRADIEKRHPFQFTDLFRMIPGFMVVRDTGFGYRLVSTRGTGFGGKCQPSIYVDGMKIYDSGDIDGILIPSEIAAVEAYAGPAGAPPQYTTGECGSILIWTGPDLGSVQK